MSEERFDRIDATLSKLTILHEDTRVQVRLIAEGLVATNERMDRGFTGLRADIQETNTKLDTFIRAKSVHDRQSRQRLDDHERRIITVEKR